MSGGHSTYVPKTRIGRWFDARLPLPRLVHDSFIVYPVPRNLNYAYTFGGILTVMLASQIVTGIVLAMHYTTDTTLAFNSVEKIMRDVNSGWLMRYLHMNGASFFFIAVYVHIFRGLYYGSYKAPRELLWILGVIIFLLMMATAFMGYVLPWGQMSFWGATVITNLFSAIPLVGDWIVTCCGAASRSTTRRSTASSRCTTCCRSSLSAWSCLHVVALHVLGSNNPLGIDVQVAGHRAVPSLLHVKDGFGDGVFLIVFRLFRLLRRRTTWAIPTTTSSADPLVTPAHIVPEWYFLPFYAILRAITSTRSDRFKLGGVLAMFGAIAVLFLLPWLDTSGALCGLSALVRFFVAVRRQRHLPRLAGLAAGGGCLRRHVPVGDALLFRVLHRRHAVLGLIETPRRLPNSITEAVLDKSKAGSTAEGVRHDSHRLHSEQK